MQDQPSKFNFLKDPRFEIFVFIVIVVFLFIFFKFDTGKKPNILFIVVDDLRPELKCYGKKHMETQWIDHLAKNGVLFTMAYSQVPVCLPTRQSFLTGKKPTLDLMSHFRVNHPDIYTLPSWFKKQGYHTESIGKVFHLKDEVSWNVSSWAPSQYVFLPEYAELKNVLLQFELYKNKINPRDNNDLFWTQDSWYPASIWEAPDINGYGLVDSKTAYHAIERLQDLKKNSDSPFFLAVGFFRPHLPFVAPKKYYDLYPKEEIELPKITDAPIKGVPYHAHAQVEWRAYHGVPKTGLPSIDEQKNYLRGYYASVSYVDACIGKLIRELDDLGLSKNTIVVLLGDQGYQLFENGMFGKNTIFELANRVPLIIRYPHRIKSHRVSDAIVELIDLFPTLCDLANVPKPFDSDGISFANLLKGKDQPLKEAALSQVEVMGYVGVSLRTNEYRYNEWRKKNMLDVAEDKELYEYDDDLIEKENIVSDPANKETVFKLSKLANKEFERLKGAKNYKPIATSHKLIMD